MAVMHSVSDLDPAGAQTQALACKLQDNRSDGAVLDPDIRLSFLCQDNHTQSCSFQEAGAVFFGPGELHQQRPIGDKKKAPGVDAAGRRGAQSSLHKLFDQFLFYLFVFESSNAAPVSQYVEHDNFSNIKSNICYVALHNQISFSHSSSFWQCCPKSDFKSPGK